MTYQTVTNNNAVWVDVDHACGQCHGGGTAYASTTAVGTVAAGSTSLTVASPTGISTGNKIRVAGAGALTYDDPPDNDNDGSADPIDGDFDTYVLSVAGSTVTLAGKTTKAVTNPVVIQNPTKNGATYKTKAELASKALGIHTGQQGIAPYIAFSYALGSPNTLQVNVDASASTCRGDAANCDSYTWSWGDATPDGTGVTASHTYATGGTKTITLTVREYGKSGGTSTKNVTVVAPDYPPAISSTNSFDPNTWIATLTDTSTDDGTIRQVTVNWGDGSMLTSDTVAPFGPYTHTYLVPGTYTVTHKAIDNRGQASIETYTVSPAYFTISGTVYKSGGVLPVPNAIVTLKKAGVPVKTVYTSATGTFTASSLKPATYQIYVAKTGYTFPNPTLVTVGPNNTTANVVASASITVTPKPSGKTINVEAE